MKETQYPYPLFGHSREWIFKKIVKIYIAFKWGVTIKWNLEYIEFCDNLSFTSSSFFSPLNKNFQHFYAYWYDNYFESYA
jgi:hypothetical protein